MKGCKRMVTRVFVHDWDGALEFYTTALGRGVTCPSVASLAWIQRNSSEWSGNGFVSPAVMTARSAGNSRSGHGTVARRCRKSSSQATRSNAPKAQTSGLSCFVHGFRSTPEWPGPFTAAATAPAEPARCASMGRSRNRPPPSCDACVCRRTVPVKACAWRASATCWETSPSPNTTASLDGRTPRRTRGPESQT